MTCTRPSTARPKGSSYIIGTAATSPASVVKSVFPSCLEMPASPTLFRNPYCVLGEKNRTRVWGYECISPLPHINDFESDFPLQLGPEVCIKW